jgi:hypothetical protein
MPIWAGTTSAALAGAIDVGGLSLAKVQIPSNFRSDRYSSSIWLNALLHHVLGWRPKNVLGVSFPRLFKHIRKDNLQGDFEKLRWIGLSGAYT